MKITLDIPDDAVCLVMTTVSGPDRNLILCTTTAGTRDLFEGAEIKHGPNKREDTKNG